MTLEQLWIEALLLLGVVYLGVNSDDFESNQEGSDDEIELLAGISLQRRAAGMKPPSYGCDVFKYNYFKCI